MVNGAARGDNLVQIRTFIPFLITPGPRGPSLAVRRAPGEAGERPDGRDGPCVHQVDCASTRVKKTGAQWGVRFLSHPASCSLFLKPHALPLRCPLRTW